MIELFEYAKEIGNSAANYLLNLRQKGLPVHVKSNRVAGRGDHRQSHSPELGGTRLWHPRQCPRVDQELGAFEGQVAHRSHEC